MFGLDNRNSRRGQFAGAQSSVRLGSPANASQTINNQASWVYDNIITYNTRIKTDHSIFNNQGTFSITNNNEVSKDHIALNLSLCYHFIFRMCCTTKKPFTNIAMEI